MQRLLKSMRAYAKARLLRATNNEQLVETARRLTGARAELLELSGRLAEFEQAHAALGGTVGKVRDRVLRHAKIDVVNMGGIKLFMYTDDASYHAVPAAEKHYQLTAGDYREGSRPRRDGGESNLTTLVLDHYWAHALDFTVIDVGASYGFESIFTAQYARDRGHANRVIAFEPGVAGKLLAENVALNRVGDQVRAELTAVGNFTGPTLMFGEDGHSENNRFVNRWLDGEDFSYIVQADSLDAYVERHGIDTHFLVKVDTQGAEPEVLEGMRRMLAGRVTTLVTEFSPQAILNRMDPLVFLGQLSRLGTICDLAQRGPLAPVAGSGFRVVAESDFAAFVETVRLRPYEWSDLVVVPHNLPDRGELLARLTGERAG